MRRWQVRSLLGHLLLSPLVSSAHAEPINVAGVVLEIEPPTGHCEYDGTNPTLRAIASEWRQELRSSGNLPLLIFGHCEDMRRFQDGEDDELRLRQWGQISVPRIDGVIRTVPFTRAEWVSTVTSAGGDSLSGAFAAASELAGVESVQSLGVIAEDVDALYFGLVNTYSSPQRSVVAVIAFTLLDGVPVTINLYQPADGRLLGTQGVLDASRAFVSNLIELNGPQKHLTRTRLAAAQSAGVLSTV